MIGAKREQLRLRYENIRDMHQVVMRNCSRALGRVQDGLMLNFLVQDSIEIEKSWCELYGEYLNSIYAPGASENMTNASTSPNLVTNSS